jgi:hypothetical protein
VAHYNTILHQLVSLLPGHQFDKFVEDLDGDRYVKTFSTRSQLTTLLYAQAGGKQSLRDIENGLLAQGSRLYHLGLPSKVAKSTLSDANTNRDCRIYERLFYTLLGRCRDLTPKHRFRFKNPLYSLDATVIDLCLETFPWAKFRARKGALKLHYQLDHSGELPVFLTVTDGKKHELSVAKSDILIVPDSIYCFDKGYIDYAWFRRISDVGAFFVCRVKDNMVARFVGQHETPKMPGIIFDDVIEMGGFYTSQDYPGKLRHIGFYDAESDRYIEFQTNNFVLAAATIAKIYKARWQIEIFFKWIKQNLKIKTFLGTSKNAVMTQIWVAMCYYLLLAYVKYQARYKPSLFYLHRIIRETLLERASIFDLLSLNDARLARFKRQDPQLCLQL